MKEIVERYEGYDIFKDNYGYMICGRGELLHCFGTLEYCKQLIDKKLKNKSE